MTSTILRVAPWVLRLFGIAFIFAAPFNRSVVYAGAMLVIGLLCALWPKGFRSQPVLFLSLVVTALVVSVLVEKYAYPAPLPLATVGTETDVVEGSFITSDSQRVVLTCHSGSVTILPMRRIISLRVVERERPKRETLLFSLLD